MASKTKEDKNKGGRPLKFKNVKDLQSKIDAYFAECDPHIISVDFLEYPEIEIEEDLEAQPHGGALKRRKKIDYEGEPTVKTKKILSSQTPYTITGLALALDTTRETLLDYEARDRFSDTIKRAKLKIQNYNEIQLYGNNVAGVIFNLKNNYDWKDRTQVEEESKQTVTVITRRPRD